MNGEVKKYIYIIGTVCIVFFALAIFMRILPWLILAGVIAYLVTKIVKFIKGKSKEKNSDEFKSDKDNAYENSVSGDDYTNGEIIDVEYEEVDKHKEN